MRPAARRERQSTKLETATHPPGYGDPERLEPLDGHGFSNYERIFTRRTDAGATAEPAKQHGMSIADFVGLMDRAGVEVGVLRAGNAIITDILAEYPKRFIGLASISPHDGMRGVRELMRLVHDHGFAALRVSALYNMVPASDRRYYPLYAKCVELDIPVRIYTNMNYATDRPYDLGHPRHLDQIAMDFPELRIVAGLSGWPWVGDMVALLRRHPNLYCDTASHRPRYFGVPRIGLGAIPAIRQYAAAGQNHGRLVVGGFRLADGNVDRGIRRAAIERAGDRQMAVPGTRSASSAGVSGLECAGLVRGKYRQYADGFVTLEGKCRGLSIRNWCSIRQPGTARIWRATGSWLVHLSSRDLAEIADAVHGVRAHNLALAEVGRGSFPLPTLGEKLVRVSGGNSFRSRLRCVAWPERRRLQ